MKTRHGGADRVSTKSRLAVELELLGQALTAARERAGLKQSDLAARLGVPPSYLSKIENGTRRLDVIELIQIAEAMKIDPADIVHDVERAIRKQE
jgi:transcriptional regulator with XRE-family HTH domain